MSIDERVEQIQEKIAKAAARVGRTTDSVTLVGISKQQPIAKIEAAYRLGLRHFGENRADELAQKSAELAHLPDLQWHFIGQLQTRQSLPVAQHAAVFHAADRPKIAKRLSQQLTEIGRTMQLFIEVNVSAEATKGGFGCDRWEESAEQREQLVSAIETILTLPRIEVVGLMSMAPWSAPEAVIRSVFRRTRELSLWLTEQLPIWKGHSLSMGMTDDFELAIEEGATHVRIGRAIFGDD